MAPAVLLVAGFALCVVAQRRGWAPSLRTALAVGVALRVVVWIIAATNSWQPYDLDFDFYGAATAVLHHHDPMLSVRAWGWPFLPTMAFLLAGELKLGLLTHLSWPVVGRLVPVLADLALIPLIGRLANERAALRRFQYACNPIAIMVCAIHGQLEPEVLALGVGALLLARSRRSAASGVALGLSMAVGSWSLLLAPGIFIALPGWRHRLRAALSAVAVPSVILLTSPLTVGTPVAKLPNVVRGLTGLRSVVGTWGWTALVTRGNMEVLSVPGRSGTIVLVATLVAVGYLWRRADPIDLTAVLLMAFLLVSPRVGAQYLAWPLPYLTARPTRFAAPALAVGTAWVGLGYLYVPRHFPWIQPATWALASWCVIPLLLLAMPWARRQRAAEAVAVPGDDAVVPEAVTECPSGSG